MSHAAPSAGSSPAASRCGDLSRVAASLLPPLIGGARWQTTPHPPMQRRPLPTTSGTGPQAAHHPELSLREPETKKLRTKTGEEIEVRRLSPEEKAARRRRKNIIMIVLAGIAFAVALALMLNIG